MRIVEADSVGPEEFSSALVVTLVLKDELMVFGVVLFGPDVTDDDGSVVDVFWVTAQSNSKPVIQNKKSFFLL